MTASINAPHYRQGFTIIEVLIVLAIAGLILLIVFLAVPAAQRNTRNYQRHQNAAALMAEVREQQQARSGQLPVSCNNTAATCFVRNVPLTMYDNHSSSDNNVSFHRRTSPYDETTGQLPTDNFSRLQVRSYTRCHGNALTGTNASAKDLAAQYVVETFNGGLLICKEL